MPSARAIMRGFALNARLAVNGIQYASSSAGARRYESDSRVMVARKFAREVLQCTATSSPPSDESDVLLGVHRERSKNVVVEREPTQHSTGGTMKRKLLLAAL